MPSFKETANAKFKSLRKKLERRGHKAARVFKILGLSGILSVSSLATQEAKAQTRDGNQPITELRMTSDGKLIPVRSSQQSGGRTISYQQAAAQYGNQQTGTRQVRTQQAGSQTAQEIYESLPDYPRKLIKKHGYKILPELQGELNEPGCKYAVPVEDQTNVDYVLFLPIAKMYKPAGREDYVQIPVVRVSKEDAKLMMHLSTNVGVNGINPYNVYSDLLPTRENMQRDKRAELERREQDVYLENKKARIEAEEATSGLRRNRIKVEQVEQEVHKAVNVAQDIGYTLRRIKNMAKGNY